MAAGAAIWRASELKPRIAALNFLPARAIMRADATGAPNQRNELEE
jgi:hypothetical protein